MVRDGRLWIACGLIVLAPSLATPWAVAAQPVEWTVGAALLVDTDFGLDGEAGPAVVLGVAFAPTGRVAYTVDLAFARTDFPVGADALHRNHAFVTLGSRVTLRGEAVALGIGFGLGALFWDDVSETDPAFRSSADAEETAVPGLEVRFGVGATRSATLFARDHITGWYQALLDPSESDVRHRYVVGATLVLW